MTNRTVSPFLAVTAVVVFVLLAAYGETNALTRQDRQEHTSHTYDMAYCTSCHSSPGMLARMKAKEGPTHFLFRDGSAIPPQCRAGMAGPGSASSAAQNASWPSKTSTRY